MDRLKSNSVHLDFFLTVLVGFLPIILISGPFLSDLTISLSSIIFLFMVFIYKKFFYFKNIFSYIFFPWCIYLIILSFNAEDKYLSFQSSLFYFRFGVFSILIFYLLDCSQNFKKIFLYSMIFAFTLLMIDGFVQFYFGKNLIGIPYSSNRISSFFGEEKILGSYLSRLFPILVALIFLNKISSKTKIFLISIFFIGSDVLVYMSGERSAFFYLILSSTLFILLLNKLFYSRLLALIISTLIIVLLSFNNPAFKNRMIDKTINQINITNSLNSSDYKAQNINRLFAFSIQHEVLYISSLRIFNDNKFFGIGPKMFREICKKEKYIVRTELDKSINGCQTSPHNYYLQLLSETGIFGTLPVLFFFIYLSYNLIKQSCYKIILKKHYLNNYQVALIVAMMITIFPFVPTGNFFNNYISIIHFIPMGFLIYSFKKNKNQTCEII